MSGAGPARGAVVAPPVPIARWAPRTDAGLADPPPGVRLLDLVPARGVPPVPGRVWSPADGSWLAGPVEPPGPVVGAAVLAVRDAVAYVDGPVAGPDGTALAGPAFQSAQDLEAHGWVATVHGRDRPTVDLPAGCWLGLTFDSVYGHWLLDLLPRAAALDAVVDPQVPFLLGPAACRVAEDLLDLAGLGARPRVRLPAGTGRARVAELHVATSARQGTRFDAARAGVYDAVARAAAARVTPQGAATAAAGAQVGVLLSRAEMDADRGIHAIRSLVNRAEVEGVLAAAGLAVVAPQRLTVADQAVLMRTAPLVAGEGGSALINALLAPAGTTLLVLRCAANRNLNHHVTAAVAGLDLRIVEGPPIVTGAVPWWRDDRLGPWSLPIADLQAALTGLPGPAGAPGPPGPPPGREAAP